MLEFESNKLLGLLENTDTGFYVLNEDKKFIYANLAFLKYLGVDVLMSDMLGTSITDWIDPYFKSNFNLFLSNCIKSGKYKDFEAPFVSKDGSIVHLSQSAVVENTNGGRQIRVLSKDISRRKFIERNLKDAKEKAEESDKLKTAFLQNLSHEIRTPMNAIIGFSELLMSKDLPISQKEKYITYITNSGSVLLNLIDDIIDIAKIQSGQLSIKKNRSDLNSLLYDVYSSYVQMVKSKKGEDVELIWHNKDKDSSVKLKTDPLRLRQIFTNLLSNSLKFTDKGSITFGYEFDDENDKKTIQFFVKDTGIGLSFEHKEQIFDRFYKIENDKNPKLYRGAGLGLTITKNLVNLLGGEIWVESEEGIGSSFYFSFPYDDVEIVVQEKKIDETKVDPENWKGKTILVAEDEDINFIYIEELLNKYGLNILRAKNGKEAVEMFERTSEISMVFMDIKMPIMDGYEAVKHIKALNSKIPVVAQTAYALAGEREKIIASGCDDYIAKPIKPLSLFKVVGQYLS